MFTWIKAAPWLIIAALIASLAIVSNLYLSKRDELTQFRAEVKTLGEVAQKHADAQKLADTLNKETTDANYLQNIAALRVDIKRLRDSRTSGGGLRPPAAPAASPDRICFDPAKLDAALRSLDEGVLGIVESGSEAVIGLDAAKEWAKRIREVR